MASLSRSAIAACIVMSAVCSQSTAAGTVDEFVLEPVQTYELTAEKRLRHPSSREFVAGPWPRFVKKMLA
jgi:hypothetical protein